MSDRERLGAIIPIRGFSRNFFFSTKEMATKARSVLTCPKKSGGVQTECGESKEEKRTAGGGEITNGEGHPWTVRGRGARCLQVCQRVHTRLQLFCT